MPDILTPVNSQSPRSRSTAKSAPRPVRIERGRVVNVNINEYTVDVRTELPPYKPKFDIPWLVPYTHFNQGEGINFMPEVGSTCYVCESSEDGRDAFVLGWVMPDEGGAYRAGRELLNPGDIHLSTRDGNFITLRRGGIVQIGATPVCQRVFIPIRNVIQDFAENYELHTPAGDLTWSVLRKDDDGKGHQRAVLTLAAHEFADDPVNKDPIALLKIGSHGDGDDTILTLLTRDKAGGSIKTKLLLKKNGDLDWQIEGKFTLKAKGDFLVDGSAKVDMKSAGDMSLASEGAFTAKSKGKATLQSSSGAVEIKATGAASMDGSSVNLGLAQFNVVTDSPDLKVWIQQVTAAAIKSGVPCKPPILYTSQKVKA